MIDQELKDWLNDQSAKKTKWWEKNLFRKNLTAFEKENLLKVEGKIFFIETIKKKIRQIEKKGGQQKITEPEKEAKK